MVEGSGTGHVVPGSERRPLPGARELGAVVPGSRIEATLFLRRGSAPGPGPIPPRRGAFLSRSEFARTHGARRGDLELVRTFASRAGLEILEESAGRRSVRLAGAASAFEPAFDVRLRRYAFAGGTYRGRVGGVRVPRELDGVVEGVFGLDDRPQARVHLRRRGPAAAGLPSYTPLQVAQAYAFPGGATGKGQCIGILELGGGYSTADLTAYFEGLGLPVPDVTSVSVDGATNAPTGSPSGPDAEVQLDLEIAGALAPGARLVAYFAPNTDEGFLDALTTAAQDTVNRPSVISVSWGGPEPSWTAQACQALDSAAEDAGSVGTTVVAAAGDQGASDGEPGTELAVDFPASGPHVLGCGGTRLSIVSGAIASEQVWNDLREGEGATGGGVSVVFPKPGFQSADAVPTAPNGFVGRGVPDVAGDADPETGYSLLVDGRSEVLGGTSAVAPLWAALLARINEARGRTAGYIALDLYAAKVPSTFHGITVGSNGFYRAGPGWNACTGLGTPDGAALLAALVALPD
jgi:kumamolisin